jgi:aspartyl-tRNA(Asn)/glutamyl-tRNA(Gln) amidotransferase subunit A
LDIPESLKDIQKLINSGNTTLVDICQEYISRIKTSKTNAFIEIFEKEALLKAEEIQKKIIKNKSGLLVGAFVGLKDNICYKDHTLTASSKILQGFKSMFSATAVEKIINEDAIIIGRLNCDEFAMGSSNENSFYGSVKNPNGENKVPGGSSGGSAAAVAEGLCNIALGSDTGGSIRQPASFCGVVGVKPTYGRISRNGLIAYGSSFDQIGVFSKTVQDANIFISIMSGNDNFDSTVSSREANNKTIKISNKKFNIGIPEEYLNFEKLDVEVSTKIKSLIDELESKGHKIEYLKFPFLKYLVPTYYVLTTAEASSNLARYDGAHFGYRTKDAKDINSTYEKSRSEGFGIEVKRRIMLGNFVLSSGYYDAYFTKAQKVRRLIKEKTEQMLKRNHVLLLPTTPTTAFNIGEIKDHANIAGLPAISLPLGKHSNSLPFGIQLMAGRFEEEKLFEISSLLMPKN